jgi:hypothetical protein
MVGGALENDRIGYAVAVGCPGELTFTSGGGSRQRRNLVARLAAWRDKDSGKWMLGRIRSYRMDEHDTRIVDPLRTAAYR